MFAKADAISKRRAEVYEQEGRRCNAFPPLEFTYAGYEISVLYRADGYYTPNNDAPERYIAGVSSYTIYIRAPGESQRGALMYFTSPQGRAIVGLCKHDRYLEGACLYDGRAFKIIGETPCVQVAKSEELSGAGIHYIKEYIDAHVAHREYWQLDAFRARVTALFEEAPTQSQP